MSTIKEEIERRRTFAIISHPDAGKTTLTEKFLLYGGAINTAGSVKGKANAKHAVSDWMEIEKERGISVTSSILQFNFDGYCINILDTPGHQDFSEDTYRTLIAADSAVIVIDASKGQISPVFFGSALTNFGIETFLHHFLKMTSAPLPRESDQGVIDPVTGPFSGFIFKIQANMNKAHRDRIAFMRICSGKFEAGMEVYHVQGKRKQKLLQPQQVMAQSRSVIDEAYAGDVIGIFDPGTFSIGDTICAPGKKFQYAGIPTFAPEHFCRVVQTDTMKRKQFVAGITQIAQEGAIQIFKDYNLDLSEIIVGVVGVLQFDVLKYRMENEYNCEVRLDPLPYSQMRWVKDNGFNLDNLRRSSEIKKAKDMRDNPLLLFQNEWNVRMCLENNEGLELEEVK